MLSFKQRETRENLRNRQDGLREELAFSLEEKTPWRHENWQKSNGTGTCEKHGEFRTVVLTGPEYHGVPVVKSSRCPACLREELAQTDADLRSLHVDELLDEAGIARRFWHCEFSNYQPVNDAAQCNLDACQRYADTWPERFKLGTSMVMVGNCGTGKNHLAVSMVKNIIRNHLATAEITDVMRLTRAVKNTWRHTSGPSEDDVIERYASLDLLVIDEVGVQFGTPAEMTILQEVINARYESILPTILISNLTVDQLKTVIGERIVDRVTDGGRNRLAFGWGSYRAIAGGVTA